VAAPADARPDPALINWKAALALLAVLVGLAVFLYLSQPRPVAGKPPLIPCDQFNSLYVDVRGQGKETELERPRAGDPWRVTRPVAAPAEPVTVQFLLDAIRATRVMNTLDRPQPLAAYGLVTPRLVLTCRVTNGASYTLSVGDQTFDASGYFAQRAGDSRVYVISGVEVDRFQRTLDEAPVRASPSPSPST